MMRNVLLTLAAGALVGFTLSFAVVSYSFTFEPSPHAPATTSAPHTKAAQSVEQPLRQEPQHERQALTTRELHPVGICGVETDLFKGHTPRRRSTKHIDKGVFADTSKANVARFVTVSQGLPNSIRMDIHDPSTDKFISGTLARGALWDADISVWALDKMAARPGGLVIDAGANIGWFTMLAASTDHPVISFEPVNTNIIRLLRSVHENKWDHLVTAYHNALGHEHTTVRMKSTNAQINKSNFHIERHNGGQLNNAGLDESVTGLVYGQDYFEVITLDDVRLVVELEGLEDMTQSIALLKVDVETFEPRVLNGAKRLLCNLVVPYITMEFFASLNDDICDANEMFEFLHSLGYTFKDDPKGADLPWNTWSKWRANLFLTLTDTSSPPARRVSPPKHCL